MFNLILGNPIKEETIKTTCMGLQVLSLQHDVLLQPLLIDVSIKMTMHKSLEMSIANAVND